MSNVGQAALIIVGTVVGAYFGNPELGFALGSLAGQALFPTQLPDGPKLTDNRTTTANLGVPVPIVFGTTSVAGTYLFAGEIVQSEQENGGKGGQQKTYNYNQTVAVGLCESVIDGQTAIAGVSRIWENGALVYDIRPKQGANTATGVIAETDAEYAARVQASSTYANFFTLYLGTEDQMPDPHIEAERGTVSPWRGLAYIVFPKRLLLVNQGLRHPNFQFEVFTSGQGECHDVDMISTNQLYEWRDGLNPLNPLNNHIIEVVTIDPVKSGTNIPDSSIQFTNTDDALAYIETLMGFSQSEVIGYACYPPGSGGPTSKLANYLDSTDPATKADGYFQVSDFRWHLGRIELSWNFHSVPAQNFFWQANAVGVGGGISLLAPGQYGHCFGTPIGFSSMVFIGGDGSTPSGNYLHAASANGNPYLYTQDAVMVVYRKPVPPLPLCYGLPDVIGHPDFCLNPDGTWQKKVDWTYHTNGDSRKIALQKYSGFGFAGDNVPLGPVIDYLDPKNNEAFWLPYYEAAVAQGSMDAGKVYGVDYPVVVDEFYTVTSTVCEGSGGVVRVGDIIRAICARAGYDVDAQIDCTDMDSQTVDGYAIASICSGNSIIMPLRSIAYFDAVESGDVLRFQSRGKPIVATLTTNDIGAYDVSQGGATVPPSVQISRTMDVELPRSIRVHYIGTQRDYQDAEQDSLSRTNTTAVNDEDVQLPYALHDTQALQAADVLMWTAWAERNSYVIAVDQRWSALEGGDCIAIPVEGFTKRVRIGAITSSSGVLRKLNCVLDDDAAYVSERVAGVPAYIPPIIPVIYGTELFCLDIPLLQDSDNDAGFYVAGCRLPATIGNQFTGFTVFKSTDNGESFDNALSVVAEAVVGSLYSALIDEDRWYTWDDDDTQIDVTVVDSSMTFESLSDDAVLAGGNMIAVGAPGRWELIQFAHATQLSATRWQLSRILRGRKGTQYLMGTHELGDSVVLLDLTALGRVPLNIAEIGINRIYKAVSIGNTFDTGVDTTFAGQAIALKTYSPVHPTITRQTDGDLLITWMRRDRLGRTFMLGNSDAPLSFSIDIVSTLTSPRTVLRTLTSSTASVIYTAAQQMADHGSSLAMAVEVAIYQLSATTGRRGTPLVTTLEVST